MPEILGLNVPISFGGASETVTSTAGFLGDVTLWLTVIFAFMIIGGGYGAYWFIKVYKYKIIVYENVAGLGYRRTLVDRARTVKFGQTGEEILFLKKTKVYRSAYGKKMAKNEFWFAVGQDGYWYNIILGDLDAGKGMLDIEPTERDLRAFHVSMGRNIRDRYRKKTQERVVAIAVGGLIIMALIMVVGGWYMLDKMGENAQTINAGIEASAKVTTATEGVLSALNNVLNQGGGSLKPAG